MVRSFPHAKARFKGEFIRQEWDKTGKTFLKEAKILKSLNHPNVVNFKNVCFQPLTIIFEYVSFSFSPFGTVCEISGLDEFLRFLDYFLVKKMKLFFPKISLDLIDGLQFLHNNGIAHRALKPANILVSNKHYANNTEYCRTKHVHKKQPTQCKLTDFGESRSLIKQELF